MQVLDRGIGYEVICIRNQVVGANTYLIRIPSNARNSVSETTVVVDPGSSFQELDMLLLDSQVTPVTLLTHGHFDHVLGAARMAERGSPVYMHSWDARHLARNNFYLKALSYPERCDPFDFIPIEESAPVVPGLEVLFTPGHSAGSCTFILGDLVITGDSILDNRVLSDTVVGSDASLQLDSVERVLSRCHALTMVLPGHGRPLLFPDLVRANNEVADIMRRRSSQEI